MDSIKKELEKVQDSGERMMQFLRNGKTPSVHDLLDGLSNVQVRTLLMAAEPKLSAEDKEFYAKKVMGVLDNAIYERRERDYFVSTGRNPI